MSLRPSPRLYQDRGSVQTVAPSAEPVTLAEVKALMVIDGTADDALLHDMISEAREIIEDATGLALVTQEWVMTLDAWPNGNAAWWDGWHEGAIGDLYGPASLSSLELPRYPLQTVDAVTVYSEDGAASAVVVADVFDVDNVQRPGRMTIKRGATWPIALRANNAIRIEYTAGFGDPADVPASLKRAVKQMVGYMYAHRGDGCDPTDAFTESGASAIVGRYKVVRI